MNLGLKSISIFSKTGPPCEVIFYETSKGRTTASRCLPLKEKYKKTPFKKQVIENTDQVENLQYGAIALVILDVILNIYKIYAQRLQTLQIITAQVTKQNNNSPNAQRRNSQYALQMA